MQEKGFRELFKPGMKMVHQMIS